MMVRLAYFFACCVVLPGTLSAQRLPVLRQIEVPHSYYYREMYLAEFFLAWINRLQSSASAHTAWNSEAERNSTLDLIRRARDEFLLRRIP